jgi:hypothetical protein
MAHLISFNKRISVNMLEKYSPRALFRTPN